MYFKNQGNNIVEFNFRLFYFPPKVDIHGEGNIHFCNPRLVFNNKFLFNLYSSSPNHTYIIRPFPTIIPQPHFPAQQFLFSQVCIYNPILLSYLFPNQSLIVSATALLKIQIEPFYSFCNLNPQTVYPINYTFMIILHSKLRLVV